MSSPLLVGSIYIIHIVLECEEGIAFHTFCHFASALTYIVVTMKGRFGGGGLAPSKMSIKFSMMLCSDDSSILISWSFQKTEMT